MKTHYRTYLGTGVDSPVVLWQDVHIMEDEAGEVAPQPPRLGHAGVHQGGAVEGPRVRLLHDEHPELYLYLTVPVSVLQCTVLPLHWSVLYSTVPVSVLQ